MAYSLATTDTKVQWYVVDTCRPGGIFAISKGDFDPVDVLDLYGPGALIRSAQCRHVRQAPPQSFKNQ